MARGTYLAGVTICTLLFAFYLYEPMPEGVQEPLTHLMINAVMKTVKDVISIIAWTGYMDTYSCQRAFFNYITTDQEARTDGHLEVSDVTFDGVNVRMYTPRIVNKNLPGIIFIHGGGFVLFSSRFYDPLTRQIAKDVNAVLISIDYRLAPEHPYPEPLNDCVKAVKYFTMNAAEFGVDPDRIAIAGDSAGGNLAMAVSLKLQTDDLVKRLRVLVLIYPGLQMIDFNTPSYQTFGSSPFALTKRMSAEFWANYVFGSSEYADAFMENKHTSDTIRKVLDRSLLPDTYRKQDKCPVEERDNSLHIRVQSFLRDKYISPILASNEELKKLPFTYVMTCEYDVLRDEGFILVERMRKLDISVTHKHWEGVQHAFISPGVPLQRSKDAVAHVIEYLKSELQTT